MNVTKMLIRLLVMNSLERGLAHLEVILLLFLQQIYLLSHRLSALFSFLEEEIKEAVPYHNSKKDDRKDSDVISVLGVIGHLV